MFGGHFPFSKDIVSLFICYHLLKMVGLAGLVIVGASGGGAFFGLTLLSVGTFHFQ